MAGVMMAPPAGLECLQKELRNPFPAFLFLIIGNHCALRNERANSERELMEDCWYSPPSRKVLMYRRVLYRHRPLAWNAFKREVLNEIQ